MIFGIIQWICLIFTAIMCFGSVIQIGVELNKNTKQSSPLQYLFLSVLFGLCVIVISVGIFAKS